MSTVIEDGVVKLSLDQRQFGIGISSAVRSISSLTKSFVFRDQHRELDALGRSMASIPFHKMAEGIDSLNNKISITGIMVASAVNNITNSVINSAKQLFDTVVTRPMRTGLQEYETQMNSVQTILANTAKHGTDLKDVNGALDRLNAYADKTIYNFTQMTDAIGRFTVAGMDLDRSVMSIMGMSNVAAIQGADAESNARAQYQLSQAMSAGVIMLQDWRSIENASMGGQIFQDSIIETARVHGVNVDAIIKKHGSFRASLEEKWLTADIMADTLAKFTGELTDAQLLSMGYTEEQVAQIQEQAQTALDAATKVKTVSQLMSTLNEAMQSGWAMTWRLIIGDFEEAREFFTGVSEKLGNLISFSADRRNDMLKMWADAGGRDMLVDSLNTALSESISIFHRIRIAIEEVFPPLDAVTVFLATISFRDLIDSLRMSDKGIKQFKSTVTGIASAFDIVKMAVEAVLKSVFGFAIQNKGVLDSIKQFASDLGKSTKELRDWIKETSFFDKQVSDYGSKFREIGDAFGRLFDAVSNLGPIKALINLFNQFGTNDAISWLKGLKEGSFNLLDAFIALIDGATWLVEKINEFGPIKDLTEYLNTLTPTSISDFFTGISDSISGFFDKIKGYKEYLSGLFSAMDSPEVEHARSVMDHISGISWEDVTNSLGGFVEAFTNLKDRTTEFFDNLIPFKERVKEGFEALLNSTSVAALIGLATGFKGASEGAEELTESTSALSKVPSVLDKVFGVLNSIASALGSDSFGSLVSSFFSSINTAVTNGVSEFSRVLNEADLPAFFEVLNAAIWSSILLTLRGGISKVSSGISSMFLGWAPGGEEGWLGTLHELIFGKQTNVGTIKDAFVGLFSEFTGVLKAFQSELKAEAMLKIALALAVIIGAAILLTFVDQQKLLAGVLVIGFVLAQLFGATGVISKLDVAKVIPNTIAMLLVAFSLIAVMHAIEKVINYDFDKMMTGVGMIGLLMLELAAAIKLLTFGSEVETLQAAFSLLVVAFALTELSKSTLAFGEIDPKVMVTGLTAIGVVLAGFSLFSKVASGKQMLLASFAIARLAFGLAAIGGVIKFLGSMSWEELAKGLITMTGALMVLALTAMILDKAKMGSFAIIAVAAGALILAVALKTLASLSWEQLLVALAGLAGVLIVLGVGALILAPLVPVLLAIAIVFALIGASALVLGIGIMTAAAGLALFAASAALIAGSIALVGAAIIGLIPMLGSALALGITNFVETLAGAAPRLYEAGKILISTFIMALVDNTTLFVSAVFQIITAFLQTVLLHLPMIISAGWGILIAFLQGIRDNIYEVATVAADIFINFLAAMEEKMPELIDAGFSFIGTYVTAMYDAIAERAPGLIERMTGFATDVVNGFISGVNAKIGEAVQAVMGLGQQAIDGLAGIFKINSPSKVMFDMATNVAGTFIGTVKSLAGGAVTTFETLARNSQNGIRRLANAINDTFDESLNFTPLITPAVDMSGVNTAISSFNPNGSYAHELESFNHMRIKGGTHQEETSNGTIIQFIQTNNSPKHLSAEEVYRNTAGLLARHKQKG